MKLTPQQTKEISDVMKARFEKNMLRHQGLEWVDVQTKLASAPEKLRSLIAMEARGGEQDVIGFDVKWERYIFCDCLPESPKDRGTLCYDPGTSRGFRGRLTG